MVQQDKKHYNAFGPYRLGKTIGQGEFAKVKLGYHLQTNKEIAIKLIKKETIALPTKKQKLIREITILQSLHHRYVVKLWQVLETEHYIGMVMEYASGGELFQHILARKYLKEPEAAKYFSQLIIGVQYLHSRGIVHRDLKLENLLLNRNRDLIITDFGFANRVSKENNDFLSTSCGSPCYAAPELVVNDSYVGEAADIWSCGVILYAIICGYLPFDDDPENIEGDNINLLYKYILNTKLRYPLHVSSLAKSLINRILVTDPTLRAGMEEIKSHSWLSTCRELFLEEERLQQNTLVNSTPDVKNRKHDAKSVTVPYISPISTTQSLNFDSDSINTVSTIPPTAEAQDVRNEKEIQTLPPDQAILPQTPQGNRISVQKRNSVDLPKLEPIVDRVRAQSLDNPRPYQAAPGLGIIFVHLDDSFVELKEQERKKDGLIAMADRNSLKFHNGPIDQRALSNAPPQKLIEKIEVVLNEMKFEVTKTTERFKVKIIWDPKGQSNSKPVSGITNRETCTIFEKKRRQKIGSALATFPLEVVNRIKYMGIFGMQYNLGFDGKQQQAPKKETVIDQPIKMYLTLHRIHNLEGLVVVNMKRSSGDIWEFKRKYQQVITKLNLGIDHAF